MGFYGIEQKGGEALSRSFLTDLASIQSQLNSVEDALNVFGNTSLNTRFRAFNGASAGVVNIPHMKVSHPVLGNTYLREAIDWLRAQKGAPQFGWESVPSAAEWGSRSWKEGVNRRWINGLRQAIGRVVTTGGGGVQFGAWAARTDNSPSEVLTVINGSGSVGFNHSASAIFGNRSLASGRHTGWASYPGPNISGYYLIHGEAIYNNNTNTYYKGPETVLRDNDPDLDTGGAFLSINGIEVIRGATSGTGAFDLHPFESAYEPYIQIKDIGLVPSPQQPGSTPGDVFGSASLATQAEAYGYRRIIVGNRIVDDPMIPVVVINNQDLGGFKWVSGNTIPTSASQVLSGGGTLNMEDRYFWIVPENHLGEFLITKSEMPSPEIFGPAKGWANESVNNAFGGDAEAMYRGQVWRSAYGSTSWIESRFGGGESQKRWIYWTREVLPLAEGWPNDPFTN